MWVRALLWILPHPHRASHCGPGSFQICKPTSVCQMECGPQCGSEDHFKCVLDTKKGVGANNMQIWGSAQMNDEAGGTLSSGSSHDRSASGGGGTGLGQEGAGQAARTGLTEGRDHWSESAPLFSRPCSPSHEHPPSVLGQHTADVCVILSCPWVYFFWGNTVTLSSGCCQLTFNRRDLKAVFPPSPPLYLLL